MQNICKEAEESLDYEKVFEHLYESTPRPLNLKEVIASSAVKIAYELKAKLIVVFSETGATTRYLSKYKPIMPVISICNNKYITNIYILESTSSWSASNEESSHTGSSRTISTDPCSTS
jgi:pyruvate kinase